MATKKPRVTITFEPELHAIVSEFSEMNGESISKIVNDLLETVAPIFQNVIRVGKEFHAAQDDAKERMRANFEAADQEVGPQFTAMAEEFLAALDAATDGVLAQEDPRPVTRGSGPPHPPTHLGDGETIE